MEFIKKPDFAEDVGDVFGEYVTTFTSDTGQVHAELFRQGDGLVAYITFAEGRQINDITDKYIGALKKHAADVGYPDKLRILYPES